MIPNRCFPLMYGEMALMCIQPSFNGNSWGWHQSLNIQALTGRKHNLTTKTGSAAAKRHHFPVSSEYDLTLQFIPLSKHLVIQTLLYDLLVVNACRTSLVVDINSILISCVISKMAAVRKRGLHDYKDSYQKMKILSFYSLSCCFKPMWLTFFYGTQKERNNLSCRFGTTWGWMKECWQNCNFGWIIPLKLHLFTSLTPSMSNSKYGTL